MYKLKYYLLDNNRYYLILITTYSIANIIGIAHHEMWHDELESWLIARDSSSLSELYSNLTYVGHPFLWYLCLYLLAKITHNPVIMQICHLIIITGTIYIFLCFSPFNKLQKTLFCFGYFPLYEYGIISRNYSFGLLFIFIFCALYCQRKRNYVLLATSLALATQTNIYSLIISFVLASMVFAEEILNTISRNKKLCLKRQFYMAAVIYLFGLLTATAQIIRAKSALSIEKLESTANFPVHPVADFTIQQDNYNFVTAVKNYLASASDFEEVLTGIWRSYVPIPISPSKYLWGSNFLVNTQKLSLGTINFAILTAVVLSLLLFSFFIAVFIKQKKVLFTYVCGTVAIYIFGFVAKIPLIRHNGHLFILLIVCYWLFYDGLRQKSDRSKIVKSKIIRFARKKQTMALTIILFIQLYAGMELYIRDLVQPFSNIVNVAQFIKNNQLEDSLIVGTMNVFPLSAWLNREIYYPEMADFGTYTVTTPKSIFRNSDLTELEIIQQAQTLNKGNSKLLLVTDKQLQIDLEDFNIRLLAAFQKHSLVYGEYFIYLIK